MSRYGRSLVAAVAIAAATGAQSQTPGTEAGADTVAALHAINATLERVAEALVRQSKLDLIARRIELGATEIAEAERLLHGIEQDQESLASEAERLDDEAERIRRHGGTTMDLSPQQLEAVDEQLAAERVRLANRSRDLERRAAEYQARVDRQRIEFEQWRTYLDRLLGEL